MTTMLMVEDNEPSRDALSAAWQRRGYDVADRRRRPAGRDDGARDRCRDLILMDLGLPVHRRLGSDPRS